MTKYTQKTGNIAPNGQAGHGEPTNPTEVTHPGPNGNVKLIQTMHTKALNAHVKRRNVVHAAGKR